MNKENVYKWSTIDRLGTTVVTFTGNIILAQLLSPDDFGLLAMVGIFSGLAYNITSCGLSDGLIQKPHPTETDYSTVFVFNTMLGIVFGLAFFACAPLIADMFGQPALVAIMRVIGVCFALQSMSLVQETRLRKALRTKAMAFVHISSSVCAVGLGILLALKGLGYWGLVSCRIFLNVFVLIFSVIATRWWPRLLFSMRSFREFFSFGANLMISYCCQQVGRNINATVLGGMSPSASGIYSQAQKMEEVPFAIIDSSVTQTFYPVAAKELDPGMRHKHVMDMFAGSVLINFTITLLLLLLSRPGFMILFGMKWVEAIDVFRILLVFGLIYNIKIFIVQVIKLHARTSYVRNMTIVEVIVQIGALVALYRYGILWTAVSQVIAVAAVAAIYLHLLRRFEQVTWRRLLSRATKPLAAPLAAFAVSAAGYALLYSVVGWFILACVTALTFMLAFYGAARLIPRPEYDIILRRLPGGNSRK